MNVSGFEIENAGCEKILGIKVDYELEFKNYLDVVIKKASNKINALPRVASSFKDDSKEMRSVPKL